MNLEKENSTTFFSRKEEEKIISAIKKAEKQTSGEICVHISQTRVSSDSLEYVQRIFNEHRLFNTKDRNAVLIFISLPAHKVYIYGDIGINKVVEDYFWYAITNKMVLDFKEGKYVEGLCTALQTIGEKLKKHFPYTRNDINELPDEITYS